MENRARRVTYECPAVATQLPELAMAHALIHDLNNLLMPILCEAELLASLVPEGSPMAQHVERILSAAEDARDLSAQLLTVGREPAPAMIPTVVNDLIRQTARLMSRILPERIRVVLALDPALAPIRSDQGQLKQVLINLVINARDAMPEGGALTITTASAGDQVILEVDDTGVGMDEATRARIFDPYFTTKAPGHGTGLGLASVYGIVQRHGGTIEIETAPGDGTRVVIRLPRG